MSRSRADGRLGAVAARLTDRDRSLLRLIEEHRVFTTHQLAQFAFDSPETARHRILTLYRLGILDRFRPFQPAGSAPYHYVLGSLGAAVLAAERAQPLDYRRDKVLAIAHSQRLAHQVGVNGIYAALAAAIRTDPARHLEWWTERRCADRWGHVVRPDAFARWRNGTTRLDVFIEYDRATEDLTRLVGKLADYTDLATISGVHSPVLFFVPTPAREAAFHRMLPEPVPIPVATTTAQRDPTAAVWRPAHTNGARITLTGLANPDHWAP